MVQSDNIPEADHSINTVQKKGAAVSHSSGGKIPWVQWLFIVDEDWGSSFTDTLNMSGHPLEDGMHSQRIGNLIQP